MVRSVLLVALVVLVGLGLWSASGAQALAAEAVSCCPGESDDEAPPDSCCTSAGCLLVGPAAPSIAGGSPESAPPRPAPLDPTWTTSAEQRARDRHVVPPTRPPIG